MNGILHSNSEISHVYYHVCTLVTKVFSKQNLPCIQYWPDSGFLSAQSLTTWLRPPQTDDPPHWSLLRDWGYQPPQPLRSDVSILAFLWHAENNLQDQVKSLGSNSSCEPGSKCLCWLALPLGTSRPRCPPVLTAHSPFLSSVYNILFVYINLFGYFLATRYL